MKYVIILLLVISLVTADCDSSQIDINSASLDELDKLDGIGEVKAQAIIDERDFDSIDELIDVKGIGEVTLDNIKNQGLACIEEENDKIEEVLDKTTEEPAERIVNKKIKTIELYEEEAEILVYESKESVILKYLPYVVCVILLFIISYLMWQRF